MGKERAAAGLDDVLAAVYEAVRGQPPALRPHVAFYPYVGTKSTLRERDGRLYLRISDHLEPAPESVLRGLMALLVSRVYRAQVPRSSEHDVASYHAFIHDPATQEKRTASRQARGSKRLDPIGTHRSLLESYLRVTTSTDLRIASPPRLSWSPTASRRRFGHHDPDHDCIVLSRALDDPKVPEFVLDFVVYHELLHIVHPPIMGRGSKRNIHHKAFRDAEAKFPRRDEAEAWLARLTTGRPL